VQTALLLEHRNGAAEEIAEFWASAGLPYFMTYADQLSAVTRPQINAYVRRYLHAPMVVGLLAPLNSGQALRPPLAGLLTAPMSTAAPTSAAPAQ
jgi:hypothetical protein